MNTSTRKSPVVLVLPLPAPKTASHLSDPLGSWPGIAIEYLAAVLERAGYEVATLEWKGDRNSLTTLANRIVSVDPSLVGVSLTSANVELTEELLGLLRSRYAGPIVLGGYTATFHARELLSRWRQIDFVVLREGEEAIVRLMDHLLGKLTIEEVPNLAFRRGDEILLTEAAAPTDVQSIPWMRRIWPGRGDLTPLLSRRGCAYHCSFCSIHEFYDQRFPSVRFRSPEDVAEEFIYCLERDPAKHIAFYDDNFGLCTREERQWAMRFVRALARRGVSFPFSLEARVTDVIKGKDLLPELRSVGLAFLSMGVESLLPRQLKLYGKGYGTADVFKAAGILDELGVDYQTNIIFWDPFSTIDEALEHVELLDRLGIQDQVLSSNLLFFMLSLIARPGTRIFSRLHAEEMLRPVGGSFYSWQYSFRDPDVRAFHSDGTMGRLLCDLQGIARVPSLWLKLLSLQQSGRGREAGLLRAYGREVAHLDFSYFRALLGAFAWKGESGDRRQAVLETHREYEALIGGFKGKCPSWDHREAADLQSPEECLQAER